MSQDEMVRLRREHRELDTRIKKGGKHLGTCPHELKTLKLQKLQMRDQLAAVGAA